MEVYNNFKVPLQTKMMNDNLKLHISKARNTLQSAIQDFEIIVKDIEDGEDANALLTFVGNLVQNLNYPINQIIVKSIKIND